MFWLFLNVVLQVSYRCYLQGIVIPYLLVKVFDALAHVFVWMLLCFRHNKLLRAKLATVGFIQLLIKIRFPKIPSTEMSSSSILVSAKMLTSMPDAMATTLAMAYCMVRSWFLMLMCLSTTPCTRAPNRKFT